MIGVHTDGMSEFNGDAYLGMDRASLESLILDRVSSLSYYDLADSLAETSDFEIIDLLCALDLAGAEDLYRFSTHQTDDNVKPL